MKENTAMHIIEKAIDYIETHINKKITLDQISNDLFVSKYHLHRLFAALTNKKLAHYINSRKLAASLQELLYTDLRIVDIAQQYGFNYEQTYIRSFIREFGISPDAFRKGSQILSITDRLCLDALNPIEDMGVVFEPVFVVKPSFYAAGRKYRIHSDSSSVYELANDAGINFIKNDVPRLSTDYSNKKIYTAIVYLSSPKCIEYMPYIEMPKPSHVLDGFVTIKIMPHQYACFKYIGLQPYDKVTSELDLIYRYIFDVWLEKSPYCLDGGFLLERADMRLSKEDYCEFEIYIPVAKKYGLETVSKITL